MLGSNLRARKSAVVWSRQTAIWQNVVWRTRNGETDLTWVNHATNATFIIILKSVDGIYWTTVTTINDPRVSSYTVRGLDPSQAYFFAVVAGNPN